MDCHLVKPQKDQKESLVLWAPLDCMDKLDERDKKVILVLLVSQVNLVNGEMMEALGPKAILAGRVYRGL